MGIKVYKPTTNGRRNMTSLDFAEITTSTPEKSLLVSLKNKAGRNNNGRITVRHQGGGHKRHYRLIDFKRNKDGVEAVVKTIEYDPNRTANIALVHYTDGVKAYIIAPKGLEVGQRIVSGPDADIKVGNALPLANIPVGTVIHNIELKPGKGAAFVRTKMKNLQTGSVVERTFNAGEKVPKAHVDRRRMQYLYESDGAYTFMDNETYDQVELTLEQLGEAKNFLLENMEVSIMFFQGIVIGLDLPVAVELRVVETDPGIRGDTATGGNKPAVLETGYTVKVPLFIEVDDVLRIDTRTGQYIERA